MSVVCSIAGCEAIYWIIHSAYTAKPFTLTPHTHKLSSVYALRLGTAGACEAVVCVFRNHSENPSAIISAARAMASLASVSKGNVGWFGPLMA
jgi:hypothetical protein